MLTVWCCNTNHHAPDEEIRILQRQVERHLKQPHIFQCVSQHHIDGVHNVQPINDLPGWWIKTSLFSGSVSHPRNLFLDTDVVITGSLDELVAPLTENSQIRTCLNWAVNGRGGVQSSVLYWQGVGATIIHDEFKSEWAHWPPREDRYWSNGQKQHGDQCWMTYLRDMKRLNVEYFNTDHVKSYKYHCRQGLPPGTRVVSFHGNPKPPAVGDHWVKEARA